MGEVPFICSSVLMPGQPSWLPYVLFCGKLNKRQWSFLRDGGDVNTCECHEPEQHTIPFQRFFPLRWTTHGVAPCGRPTNGSGSSKSDGFSSETSRTATF